MSETRTPTYEQLEGAVAELRAMVEGWDHFHDECFPNDPFMRATTHAEVERLAEEAHRD